MKAVGILNLARFVETRRRTISTKSGDLEHVPYTFSSRFEGAAGASPEELLGAAHAGCFNQALANNFGMIELEAKASSSPSR